MKEKPIVQNERHALEDVVPLDTPYIVYIDPSGACNLNCSFCPCNMSAYRKEERHKIMDMNLFTKIVDDLKEFPSKIKVVYLFAFGEPLLNKKLCEMIRTLKKANICEEIRLYTNGILLNKERNRELVDSGIDLIRISLNGLNAGDYKEICGCNLDYDSFYENIKDLYAVSRGKAKLAVRASNAFMRETEHTEKFFELYSPIADYVFIEDIIGGVWAQFEEIKLPQNVIVQNNWDYQKRNHDICTYTFTTMTIHSNGLVSPCCTDWKFGAMYGDVREESLVELWNSAKLRKMQLSHLRREKGIYAICDDCSFRTVDGIDDVADLIIERLETAST